MKTFPLVLLAVVMALPGSAPATDSLVVLEGASTFVDDDGNTHEAQIEAIAAASITRGCNPPVNDAFCPHRAVTRGELAAFLVRTLGLTDRAADPFIDDDDSIFETEIEKLAAAGITRGCNPPANDRFCPQQAVTRGEMAAFLVRAFGYESEADDPFDDDDGSIFEADIEKLAAAGITVGCGERRFCPALPVLRDQMASFLARAADLSAKIWQQEFEDNQFGFMFDGTAAVPAVVAVGEYQYPGRQAVWFRSSGGEWGGATVPSRDGALLGVTWGHGRFVAVGWTTPAGGLDLDGAVLVSDDGGQWSSVPHDESVFGDTAQAVGRQVMTDVIATPAGFVAVGFEDLVPVGGAAVWVSPDGLTWERMPSVPQFHAAPETSVTMNAVASDGVVTVAAGWMYDGNGSAEALFWHSNDDHTWTKATVEPGPSGRVAAGAWSVTAGPAGFVAVGDETASEEADLADVVVWVSATGEHWTRVVPEFAGFFQAVTHDGQSYLAAGSTWPPDRTDEVALPALWTSIDGLVWELVSTEVRPRLLPPWPSGLVAAGAEVLVFGSVPADETAGYPAVWSSGG